MSRLRGLLAKQRRKRAAALRRERSLIARRKALTLKLARRPALAHYLVDRFPGLRNTSNWRSVQHNRDVGGVPGSWHTRGNRRKPGASDFVGSMALMQEVSAFVRANVPGIVENLIHDAGSGLHLHIAGPGVIEFKDPRRPELRRVRAAIAANRRLLARINKRIGTIKRALQNEDAAAIRRGQIKLAEAAGVPRYRALIYDAAKRNDINYALALALFRQESGFLNQYGHDRDRNGNIIFHGREGVVMVTPENYREYLAFRKRTGLAQGVGPGQLTSPGIQDMADRRGGCHVPEHNIEIAMQVLSGHIKALGKFKGIGAYNGGRGNPQDDYARKVIALENFYQSKGVK